MITASIGHSCGRPSVPEFPHRGQMNDTLKPASTLYLVPICSAGTQQVIPALAQLAPTSLNRGEGLAECTRYQQPPMGTVRSLVQLPSSVNQQN